MPIVRPRLTRRGAVQVAPRSEEEEKKMLVLSDHTAYTNRKSSVASAGKMLAVPLLAPGQPLGLVKIL